MAEQQQYQDRTIKVNRVAKVVKGGRRFSFSALMVVGDGGGDRRPGLWQGQGSRACCPKRHRGGQKDPCQSALAGSTITHPVIGEAGAGRVLLTPAAPGTGVIAGGAARPILELAGIHDVVAKSLGSSTASTSRRRRWLA